MSYYDPQTKQINFGPKPEIPTPIFCGFCGDVDTELVNDCSNKQYYYFVVCNRCECSGPTDYDKVKAVEKWNTRYTEPRDPDCSYDGRPDYWCGSTPERKPY